MGATSQSEIQNLVPITIVIMTSPKKRGRIISNDMVGAAHSPQPTMEPSQSRRQLVKTSRILQEFFKNSKILQEFTIIIH